MKETIDRLNRAISYVADNGGIEWRVASLLAAAGEAAGALRTI